MVLPGARLTHVGLGDLALGVFPASSLSDWRTGEPYRLVELNLRNTGIDDVSGLIEFSTLEVLDLSRNDIEDLELSRHVGPGPNDFDGISGLVSLDVSDNRLASLLGLHGISTLEGLDLSGNERIGLFGPASLLEQLHLVLSANEGLRSLGLRDIPISDLAALPVFDELVTEPRLLEVNLAHTRTSDVEPLRRQPGLRVVDLGNNLITNPLGLLGLPSPTWVNLGGNPGIPCPDLDTLETLWGPGVLQRPDPCFTPNTPPEVTIVRPVDDATFVDGVVTVFDADAWDAEDGDLTARVTWSSDRDGLLGTGSPLQTTLSPGAHAITAGISDNRGASACEAIYWGEVEDYTVTVVPGASTSSPPLAPSGLRRP